MKRFIKTEHHLSTTVDKLWPLISSGENWESWFPILKGSRVDKNMRYCYLDNGDTLEESFLASNAENTFIYAIHKQASFPAEDITGIIRLKKNEPVGTTIFWSIEMNLDSDEVFEELKQSIKSMYQEAVFKLNELASEAVIKVSS